MYPYELLIILIFTILPLYDKLDFPVAEPGVPYSVSVRASTKIGKGETVSIVVFSKQQGNDD